MPKGTNVAANDYRNLSLPRGKVVPSHERSTESAELIPGKWFGKDIGDLLFGGHVLDGNGFVHDVRTKMVEANREVLGSRTGSVVSCDFDATLIVLESFADNSRGCRAQLETATLQFIDQVNHGDDLTEGRG